jgi:ferredoxin
MGQLILVDRKACRGYGNCTLAAPEVFEVDDDNRVVLLTNSPGHEHDDDVALAVAECPVRAIAVREV